MHAKLGIAAVAIAIAAAARQAAAQIDYRNLDDGRPVRTEDAYPIERYAFEAVLPYAYENGRGGQQLHVAAPELSYGAFADAQVGLRLPFAALQARGGTDWGFGGPRLFALYDFNTESPALPAVALRADLGLPMGDLAGDDVQFTLKGIATRSWGRTRLHLNGAATMGRERGRPVVDAEPKWSVSLAADRTLLRPSLLLVGELRVLEAAGSAPTEVTAGIGTRYQLTPTLVLDGGVRRRLTRDAGPDIGLTIGLTHTFAIPGLVLAGTR